MDYFWSYPLVPEIFIAEMCEICKTMQEISSWISNNYKAIGASLIGLTLSYYVYKSRKLHGQEGVFRYLCLFFAKRNESKEKADNEFIQALQRRVAEREKECDNKEKDLISARKQLQDLSTKLASEMSSKISADESSVENVSIKNRPMNVAEEYQLACSNEWLVAKDAMDKVVGNDFKDYELIDVLYIIIKVTETEAQQLSSSLHEKIIHLLYNPGESGHKASTGSESATMQNAAKWKKKCLLNNRSLVGEHVENDHSESDQKTSTGSKSATGKGDGEKESDQETFTGSKSATGKCDDERESYQKTAIESENGKVTSDDDKEEEYFDATVNAVENHVLEANNNSETQDETTQHSRPKFTTELYNSLGDFLRNDSDYVNVDVVAKNVCQSVSGIFRNNSDKTYFQIWNLCERLQGVQTYISKMTRIAWKMAIQRPQMTFSHTRKYQGEGHQDIYWNSLDPKNCNEDEIIVVYPMLYHGVQLMAKGKILGIKK